MTRQELLDALTCERFSRSAARDRLTPRIQPAEPDPDAERHVADLLGALPGGRILTATERNAS